MATLRIIQKDSGKVTAEGIMPKTSRPSPEERAKLLLEEKNRTRREQQYGAFVSGADISQPHPPRTEDEVPVVTEEVTVQEPAEESGKVSAKKGKKAGKDTGDLNEEEAADGTGPEGAGHEDPPGE